MEYSQEEAKKWYQKPAGIIALLILFFPAGLYLMWKYADWSRGAKWGVTGAIIVIGIVGAAMDDTSQTSNPASVTANGESNTSEQSDSGYEWTTEADTLLRKAETVVVDEIGEQNNMGKKTVVSIETERDGLWIKYNASESITTGSTVGNMKSEMVDVFSSLDSEVLNEFYNVTIVAKLPLVDVEGHESIENVMTVSLTTDKIKDINWDNFLRQNLERVASVYRVHPALK